ncbi:aldehyde dehydrogenase family protein [Aliarcobacter butzleri]|uniref:Aldehyde dehydrogenase family protein n=1 Tax=Aliarcobacter butzleri TaxID=28197 RepID=A0AAW6VDW8_9BACT|nr:aldehyde dehydrogenase family protein [Aliarcobacter butzleri]MCP3648665.1 aldehyde dehydrogenase family protein [Arcobacter sp. DNRA7]KLD96257.1 aldehyde dehydrogenase [Aliarcobacter butzleri L349]MCR1814838.1 aldehyde dehydrogenase family protein [Aliarcobacter butzleri]MDK2040692.1 aldehyde dehydrogenase family protein [Aliarcobacter butzleri]MDK2095446.1 aldehyde dehydrogenase family protein [Aliarcobacter butzleri]
MIYARPTYKTQYENFIGGEWIAPVSGEYFDNISPVDGKLLTKIPRSNEKDVELAIQAAKKAFESYKHTSVVQRSTMLNKVADLIEKNLEMLAIAETLDNGKAVRETLNADIPLVVDHFRYFASVIRAESGTVSDLDENTISQEIYEPYGVVAQIIPWNFPLLMAAWKLAPALAAGNCVVLKPASATPMSILLLMEIIQEALPKGVINIINGAGGKIGKYLATHPDIKKVAFTGETTTGQLIMQYATENIIPSTLELGGKSPNVFFESIMDEDDEFFDKAIEGLVLFAFNSGEVCTCPSRALIQESIYEPFMKRVLERVKAIKLGNPLDTECMMGAQCSLNQKEKILSYLKVGKEEGAELLVGGDAYNSSINPDGFYIQPTLFKGHNKMRIFQEEIFGPVLAVTTFKDEKEALEIANDTIYGLGSGVWSRDAHQLHRMSRGIQAGRVWVNCYHMYPSHASFGGYKKSGIGRETHMMMLNNYRHTKNILTSYSPNALGFF